MRDGDRLEPEGRGKISQVALFVKAVQIKLLNYVYGRCGPPLRGRSYMDTFVVDIYAMALNKCASPHVIRAW